MRSGPRWASPLVIGASLAALAARALSPGTFLVTAAVGVAGGIVPLRGRREKSRTSWLLATALGSLAFAAVALRAHAPLPRPGVLALAASAVAAVAEEAFFRRLLYGYLERLGVLVAVAGAALAFALVHVPLYGWGSFPLNLAAGLLLGWQRWASGTWTSPAVAHLIANILGSR